MWPNMQTQPFPAEIWNRMHNPNTPLNHEDCLDIWPWQQ